MKCRWINRPKCHQELQRERSETCDKIHRRHELPFVLSFLAARRIQFKEERSQSSALSGSAVAVFSVVVQSGADGSQIWREGLELESLDKQHNQSKRRRLKQKAWITT